MLLVGYAQSPWTYKTVSGGEQERQTIAERQAAAAPAAGTAALDALALANGGEIHGNGGSAGSEDTWQARLPEFRGHVHGKPCAPAEYEYFKKTIEIVKLAHGVEDTKMAPRVWLALHGEAKDAVEDIEVSSLIAEGKLAKIWERLDPIYSKMHIEKADEVNDEYWNCARKIGEAMDSNIPRMRRARRRLTQEDKGTMISDGSFAQRLLRRAGLDREARRLVLATVRGKYGPESMENALKLLYRGIEKSDRRSGKPGDGHFGKRPPAAGRQQHGHRRFHKNHHHHKKEKKKTEPTQVNAAEGESTSDDDDEGDDEPDDECTNETQEADVSDDDEGGSSTDEETYAAMAAEAFIAGFETAKKKTAGMRKMRGCTGGKQKGKTPEDLKRMKEKTKCSACGETGHRHKDPVCKTTAKTGSKPRRVHEAGVVYHDGTIQTDDEMPPHDPQNTEQIRTCQRRTSTSPAAA